MPTVWMREDPKYKTRFHRTPYCRQLRKKPARGTQHELIEVDLAEIAIRPCQTCYPDAPRVKILKTYCAICESRYACEHNGGVLIRDRGGRRYWVWPDTNQMPLYRSA
jgi:hypothetical protein